MEHDDSITELLLTLKSVMQAAERLGPASGPGLADALSTHLGCDVESLSVLSEEVVPHRFADWDVALEHLASQDPNASVLGVGGGQERLHQSLGDLISTRYTRFGVGQVDYCKVPTGPTGHRQTIGFGIRLMTFAGHPVAVMQRKPDPMYGSANARFEVVCQDAEVAADLLVEASRLGTKMSLLRGQVITFAGNGFDPGSDGFTFLPRPDVPTGDVVLPEGVLERITNHVLGVDEHTEALRRFGQHLKRGILLYGPPGTGKTHTVRHLVGRAHSHTVVLLRGMTLAYITQAAVIARNLQPAIVVLEDCDLVAADRDFTPSGAPLLFEVLDALDGLDADADVTFLLTTNRVDILEEALVQRPGRVDLAMEIPLPDLEERTRLLRVYRRDVPFSDAGLSSAAEQTDGMTAAFAKELVRRAVLEAALQEQTPADSHLAKALGDLLSERETLTRRLLGMDDVVDAVVTDETWAGAAD
ncbi:MAG: ATP-binding protein [Propionibacteriaceae bacterium]|nr:ATP-binding protein [Propionibacteriaceae bacterium]